jgi:hypothetical protein
VIGLRWVRDGCGKSGLDHLVSEHFWMDGWRRRKERKKDEKRLGVQSKNE